MNGLLLLVAFTSGFIFVVNGDENAPQPKPLVASSKSPSEWIEQLDAPTYQARQEALLALCDANLDLDQWQEQMGEEASLQVKKTVAWIKRLRTIHGPIETKLKTLDDLRLMVNQGSREPLKHYAQTGQFDSLLSLVQLIPEQIRQAYFVPFFLSDPDSAEQVTEQAWTQGRADWIPQFLDALLPMDQGRIGWNQRWRILGMPESWKVRVELDNDPMRVLALCSDGKLDEAIKLAKRSNQPGLLEHVLLKHGRWEEYVALDPASLVQVSPIESEIQKGILLESLDRHEEAEAYYQIRRQANKIGRAHV